MQTDIRQHVEAEEHQGAAIAASAATPETAATAPATRELTFQRCRWCRTPNYRRSLCRTCGSTDLAWERSAGKGVIVRRNSPAIHNTCLVTMDEGFSLVCRVTGTPPMLVVSGARVRVVFAAEPLRQALPVVELCNSASYFPH